MTKKHLLPLLKIAILVFILVICIKRISEEHPYPYGDAVEYTLVTEAFYNHFSADIRRSDYESFRRLFELSNKWEENPRAAFYDELGYYTDSTDVKLFHGIGGLFSDAHATKYGCHFFLYSLLNLPMRAVCEMFSFNPLLIHQFTNVLILLITCMVFFRYSPFGEIETGALVLLFFYSANYWYLLWQHTEIFTTCFASLGFWLFVGKRYYAGILLVSLASLQNQPLVVVAALLCVVALFAKGVNIRNIMYIGLCSFWVVLPSLFYYYHFGAISIVKHTGSIQGSLVTLNRVSGFFFDLNQGTILALPFVLLLYFGLLIQKLIRLKVQTCKWDLLVLPALIGAICIAAGIDNWNHGQAVVNRYVTYIGGIILVHCFWLIMQLGSKITKWTFLLLALSTQIATVYYHQSLSKYDWSGGHPKPISNWVLENHPRYYNPDLIIFITRYAMRPTFDVAQAPAYYMKPDGELIKILVNKEHLNTLLPLGFTRDQISSLAAGPFTNGWRYVNIDDSFKSRLSNSELRFIDNERRVANQMVVIKATPSWYLQVKEKATVLGLSEEAMLKKDAAYVLSIPKLVSETILEIKENPRWLNEVRQKASNMNISIDSALLMDARYIVDLALNKQEADRSK
ncbi:MAG: hypothetical protein H0X46_06365 [Bacteroidetes bacterium]|nr:hypothetical protein [Bacteroidota bacterium]